jgi:hypothetical protein
MYFFDNTRFLRWLAAIISIYLSLLHVNGSDIDSNEPLVVVTNGTYRGKYVREWRQDHFLGIPYAIPPVEKLRFAHPQSLNASFTGIREATQYGYST